VNATDRHVFISYSHADEHWFGRVKVHLRPIPRLQIWDDTEITPGQVWAEEIERALARANVAILLISADFFASDFITSKELPRLLERADRDGVLVLPLIISPSLAAQNSPLSGLQSVNRPDLALAAVSASDAEAILVKLARSIEKHFEGIESPSISTSDLSTSSPSMSRTRPRRQPLVVDRPLNLGFDGSVVRDVPIGWFNSFGHVSSVSTDYEIRVVPRSDDLRDGTCVMLGRDRSGPDEFGSLMQRFPGRFLAGRTVRLEGELRTEDVTGWAGLWLRADADQEPNLFFDNMSGRPVVGTSPWTQYRIEAPIPEETDWINFGIVLAGSGALYADNLRLLVWSAAGVWEEA
jgi:hypothetical protein